MPLREMTLVLAAATSLGLAACHRAGETGSADREVRPGTPAGATGSGAGSQSSSPAAGLQGGLGPQAGMQPGQAASVAEGSKNRTPAGSVGNR
jgi:hypothetical protein